MDRFPDSLIAFQRMFPHDDACAAWLASVRWPEERRQGFPEVAGGNALQIQPWQKVFQALGAAQIARQDRRREADGAVPPVPHTGLAHAHRADPGLDEAFRQISIADNPAAAGGVNKRRMATQKHGDLGLNGLGQQLASSSL